MPLDACVSWIAKFSGLSCPCFDIPTEMSGAKLEKIINGCVDELNTIFTIIPYGDNMFIDRKRSSTFTGSSSLVNDQSIIQHRVFLLYDQKVPLFEVISVRLADNTEKFRFDDAENERICNAIEHFIEERNLQSRCEEFSDVSFII